MCHRRLHRWSLLVLDWHKFKRLLASKTFAVHDTKRIRGEDLTAAWAEKGGFREPIIAQDKTGMGLKVGPRAFGISSVCCIIVLKTFDMRVDVPSKGIRGKGDRIGP